MTTPARRGAAIYMASSVMLMAGALARYTFLARILGPEQLGLAASMILTVGFFGAISDNGSDRFLIQDTDGDDPDVQRLVHLVFVLRGVFQAAAVVAFAYPAASFFKAHELVQGLYVLSLAPLISGFTHLDMTRSQRVSDFRSEGWAVLAAEIISLAVTVTTALATRSYIAVVYGSIARALVLVGVSHLMAHRPYVIGFAQAHAGRLARFSAPLIANGLLLFMASQSDRAIVGHKLGVVELGHYTAILLLSYFPTGMIMRFMGTLHLPRVARSRDAPRERRQAEEMLGGQTILLATSMAAGFALVGPTVVVLLYGPAFARSSLIVGMIGVMQAMRFVRQWPTTVALAHGRSDIVLMNNIVRMAGLLGVLLNGGLIGLLICFSVADLLAMITSLLMINRAKGDPLICDFDRLGILCTAMVCIAASAYTADHFTPVGLLVAGVASLIAAALLIVRERGTLAEVHRLGFQFAGQIAARVGR